MPRPSHPISRVIMCGIKIRRFMDATNSSTR